MAAALLLASACGSSRGPDAPLPRASSREWRREADGRRFVVRRLPKVEGRYEVRADGTVRYRPFSIYRLEREDARWLYVRVYEPQVVASPAPLTPAPRPVCEVPLAGPGLRLVREVSGLPASGQWREGFALADVDGDGRLDLVHGPPRKEPGPPRIFRGDGNGAFRPFREARFPALRYDYGDVAAGDLDGDGNADLVLAIHLRGLVALLGDGRGGFREGPPGLPATTFGSRAVELADWDGDGRLDVLSLADRPPAPGAAGFRLFRNGPGRLEPLDPLVPGDGAFGDRLAALPGGGAVLGPAVLGATRLLRVPFEGRVREVELPRARPRGLVKAVATGGALLATATTLFEADGRFSVVDLRPVAELASPRCLLRLDGDREVVSLALGDVDGDGITDLGALLADGTLLVLLGDDGGGFSRRVEAAAPEGRAGCGGSDLRIADLGFRDARRLALVASFAGEASGRSGAPACTSGGALEVWRLETDMLP